MTSKDPKEDKAKSIERLLAEGVDQVNLREVAVQSMKLCGGPAGIAGMIHSGYKEAIVGSLAHVRYVQMYVDLFKATQLKDMKVDLANVSDEDLERLLREELVKVHGEKKV